MTRTLSIAFSAALFAGAVSSAMAADTKPVTDPDTASVRQATSGQTVDEAARATHHRMSRAAARNGYQQTAANDVAGPSSDAAGFSSDPSPTQRKGAHLSAAQKQKADADEAETTRQLNQQASANAAPGSQAR